MINITIGNNACGDVVICARGHANTAPAGQDLVCAAVSILMHSLGAFLRSLPKRRGVDANAIIIEEPGFSLFCFKAKDDPVAWVFDMACMGLSDLEQAYPQAVHIVREGDENE